MKILRKFFSDVDLVERLNLIPRPISDSTTEDGAPGNPAQLDESPRRGPVAPPVEIVLDFPVANTYELSYTCLVIPRFKSHYLIGDVVKNLETWVREICISYTWRLEFLVVKPEYLEWGISVSPAIAPAHFVNLLCAHTSKLIFEEFPRYRHQNPSKHFWAAGLFAAPGLHPLSENLINEFIQSTRSNQGFQPD